MFLVLKTDELWSSLEDLELVFTREHVRIVHFPAVRAAPHGTRARKGFPVDGCGPAATQQPIMGNAGSHDDVTERSRASSAHAPDGNEDTLNFFDACVPPLSCICCTLPVHTHAFQLQGAHLLRALPQGAFFWEVGRHAMHVMPAVCSKSCDWSQQLPEILLRLRKPFMKTRLVFHGPGTFSFVHWHSHIQ